MALGFFRGADLVNILIESGVSLALDDPLKSFLGKENLSSRAEPCL